MKTLKFLFATSILVCFIGIAQTKAQTKAIIVKGSLFEVFGAVGDVYYEIDGEWYCAFSDLNFQLEFTPSEVYNWTSYGFIYLVFKWEGEGDPAIGEYWDPGWIQLDYIPLPKKTYFYNRNDAGKVTITPSGRVNVIAHAK